MNSKDKAALFNRRGKSRVWHELADYHAALGLKVKRTDDPNKPIEQMQILAVDECGSLIKKLTSKSFDPSGPMRA